MPPSKDISPWAKYSEQRRREALKYAPLTRRLGEANQEVQAEAYEQWCQLEATVHEEQQSTNAEIERSDEGAKESNLRGVSAGTSSILVRRELKVDRIRVAARREAINARARGISRRAFLVGGLRYALASAVAVNWLGRSAFRVWQSQSRALTEYPSAHFGERLELLRALLRPEAGEIDYCAAAEHLDESIPAHPEGYPDDRMAVVAFRQLDLDPPKPDRNEYREHVMKNVEHMVASGSPMASRQARLYLPYCFVADEENASDIETISESFKPKDIPYHFASGFERHVKVVMEAKGGQLAEEPLHGIRRAKNGKIWTPKDYVDPKGFLYRDFLLVSRLPRNAEGGEIILISGGHGAGTAAFELLLSDYGISYNELRNISDVLKGARYFQLVLEVEGIRHEGKQSVGRKLVVSQDCPPVAVDKNVLLGT